MEREEAISYVITYTINNMSNTARYDVLLNWWGIGQQEIEALKTKANKGHDLMITIISHSSEGPIKINLEMLENAKLDEYNFHRAVLNGYSLIGASLIKADLRNAELVRANLSHSTISEASLILCSLDEADLSNAVLCGARCYHASFRKANLSFADFTDAQVDNATFEDSVLFGANMRCSGLSEANLKGAMYNIHTIWPLDFQPQQFGAIFVD